MHNLRRFFLLDPEIVYLNHGSFGAAPRPVFAAVRTWQRELERQPVEFLGRRATGLLAESRAALADYLGTGRDNLVYVSNATVGVNSVARSLNLGPGDEVLATDHEYGACDRTWRFLARKNGFSYRNQPVSVPLASREDFLEGLWQGVTPRTKVITLSHITSPTAIILPAAAACRRAREAGILTLVDGAHAPGQIPLDLEEIGADFYTGNLHKWLCAPKGAGFLYARPEVQDLLEPLVVSWGWQSEQPGLDQHEWQGTRDLSAFLAVPAAIRFQQEHAWARVQADCHTLAVEAERRIRALTGLPSLYVDDSWYAQMTAARLPPGTDPVALKEYLYDTCRIEVPLIEWNGSVLLRVSLQGYNFGQAFRVLNGFTKGAFKGCRFEFANRAGGFCGLMDYSCNAIWYLLSPNQKVGQKRCAWGAYAPHAHRFCHLFQERLSSYTICYCSRRVCLYCAAGTRMTRGHSWEAAGHRPA